MKKLKKISAIFIIFCLLLSVCACGNENSDDTPDDEGGSISSGDKTYESDSVEMPYDSTRTFNPLTTNSLYNKAVCDLMFEGLFDLDSELEPVNILCDSFDTPDGINYTFKIRSGVYFHDGTLLTADDAVYTITEAGKTDNYKYRFSCIDSITAISDTEFCVVLKEANYLFPTLLSTKIIKSGTMDRKVPVGTGAYYYDSSSETPCLRAFSSYRDESFCFTDLITLVEKSSVGFSDAFESGLIDIANIDPAEKPGIYNGIDCDLHYYGTTTLQYIGIDFGSNVMRDQTLRRAMSLAINREYIAKEIMYGCMQPSYLIINPALCGYYSKSWESGRTYSEDAASELLTSVGIIDYDGDGWVDYPEGEAGYYSFSLKFIVNNDSSEKVKAAEKITDSLRKIGIRVNLSVLSWKEYTAALKDGNCNMYYAECTVAPDYDFLPILSSGGTLNYGGLSTDKYVLLTQAMLSSPDHASCTEAANELCSAVFEASPLIPIGYGKNAVMTHRKQLEGFSPNISNIFFRNSSAD